LILFYWGKNEPRDGVGGHRGERSKAAVTRSALKTDHAIFDKHDDCTSYVYGLGTGLHVMNSYTGKRLIRKVWSKWIEVGQLQAFKRSLSSKICKHFL
jgi:hypothetical protein